MSKPIYTHQQRQLTTDSVGWLVALSLLAMGCSGTGQPAEDGGSKAGGSMGLAGDSGNGGSGNQGDGGTSSSGGRSQGSGGGSSGGSSSSGGGAPPGAVVGCGLTNAAFCDDFEEPQPGGRGGDLDESRWHMGRWGHTLTEMFIRVPAQSYADLDGYPVNYQATFCGEKFEGINLPNDVKFCEGVGPGQATSNQLNEVFDDVGDFAYNSMRINQPFDFTNRTGKIVWEVDGKVNPVNLGHGWWFEIWVTEDPGPMPYHGAPTVLANPRRGIGFALQFAKKCEQTEQQWQNAVDSVHIMDNYRPVRVFQGFDLESPGCFKVADTKLNRFELDISKDQAIFRASNIDSTEFVYEEVLRDLDLPFERGWVHFQHAQYNAHKDGNATPVQTFRWDNIGFDGPAYPTPRSYQITDNDLPSEYGVYFGFDLSQGQTVNLPFENVNLEGATIAHFNFNLSSKAGNVLRYRFNDGTWGSFTVPLQGEETLDTTTVVFRSFTIDIPLGDLVDGTNKVELRLEAPEFTEGVANLELLLEVDG